MAGRVFFYIAFGMLAAFALATYLASWRIHHPFIILAFLVAIFALSFLVARIATAPLAHLASAADRLKNDIESAPIREGGPTEVRHAASAFNAMQARIARDVRERTCMLAAITHDLQTPVTRLRLRIEKVADETLRAKLVADLDVMRATIREGLDLATSLDPAKRLSRSTLIRCLRASSPMLAKPGTMPPSKAARSVSCSVRPTRAPLSHESVR